ncbi:solute carrier family 35 member E1 homolog [Condylostylus longicornis]|uniref:solute carrier family 35 member E1 homolog n=1 Tax=Condylostylus longicornis TaxID=2530218 RepID=UPI00244DFE14|nr:solute carrier family 35 member E1 homolog [Condylostylus longicornis]
MAVTNKGSGGVLVVFFLCILWYIVSSSNNVVGKMVLNNFPYPMTVTMVQLTSITVLSGPFFNLWGIRKFSDIPWPYYLKFIIPLAFGKFLASLTSHISIYKVPVSYAHTVKATMPLFTVCLTRLLFKEKQSLLVYLSLIPIICGVGIATMTELSFDLVGLIAALISTMGFSLQNIYSKKVLKDTGIHHLRLLYLLGRLALFIFLPIWLYFDAFSIFHHPVITNLDSKTILLLFTDGILNWLQNIIAFSVLSLVTPLTYAVASASKRIFVIALSLFILGNPVTWINVFGMTLAILGVLCYNRAKHISRFTEETILPYATNSPWTKYSPLQENIDPNYHDKINHNNVNGKISNGYYNNIGINEHSKTKTESGNNNILLNLNNNTAPANKLFFV